MLDVTDLLSVADTYRQLTGIEREVTLSYRIFGDSKCLAGLRGKKEITIGRFNNAMRWFAQRWPADHPLPDVLRAYAADLVAAPQSPEPGQAVA